MSVNVPHPPPPPTPRLALRQMTEDDLDDMAALLGDPDVMRHYPRPRTREEALAWIDWNQGLYRREGYGLWLVTLRATGEFVGDCGLTPQEIEGVTELEVGYRVRASTRGTATPPRRRQPAVTTPATSSTRSGSSRSSAPTTARPNGSRRRSASPSNATRSPARASRSTSTPRPCDGYRPGPSARACAGDPDLMRGRAWFTARHPSPTFPARWRVRRHPKVFPSRRHSGGSVSRRAPRAGRPRTVCTGRRWSCRSCP